MSTDTIRPMKDRLLRLDNFLPYRLSIASNLVSDVISAAYSRLFGLSIAEWRLIAVIAETDGITQQEIGVRTRMDKVTVSRAAIALTRRGLLLRAPNPRDGRSQFLTLSDPGEELYRHVAPQALALEQALFGAIPEHELTRFAETLSRITDTAEALLRIKTNPDTGTEDTDEALG